ncbi:MAG: PIG-L family deacetylase [Bacteroidia bacterium]
MRLFRRFIIVSFLTLLFVPSLQAQRNLKAEPPLRTLNAAEIQLKLKHSQVLGSVLYLAAHPDDENTRLIAYLTQGRGYHTTYLSLTRGDGGQNLIGTEKGPDLGIVRTNELLAARNIDGGHQRFSRAIDFGYSKGPEETLDIWDRNTVLADVVRTIRQVKPDVIVTRFPGPEDGGGGHGHHTSSYLLAKEAFDLAADPKAFPEQIAAGLKPWKTERLFWNNWFPYYRKDYDASGLLSVNIGEYNPLLGRSYGEIAADARSQHRCQAFGTRHDRGERIEYLDQKMGDKAEGDFFNGITASWKRLEGGEKVSKLLAKAESQFNPSEPEAILPLLLEAYSAISSMPEGVWKSRKMEDVKSLIVNCSGLWFEAIAEMPTASLGDTLPITSQMVKRTKFPIKVNQVHYHFNTMPAAAGVAVSFESKDLSFNGKLASTTTGFYLKPTFAMTGRTPTQPYWLLNEPKQGVYQVDEETLIGEPRSPDPIMAEFVFEFGEKGIQIPFSLPVIHKYVDRSVGELYRPFVIAPKLTVNVVEGVYIFSEKKSREVGLQLKSHAHQPFKGKVQFKAPVGWTIEPAEMEVSFEKAGEERPVSITLTPPDGQSVGNFDVLFQPEGGVMLPAYSLTTIEFDHIPTQLRFPRSTSELVKIDLQTKGNKVAYIMGSGDEVPTALRQVGYTVDLLDDDDITQGNLQQYDAVIAGIRAYNTRNRLAALQQEIFKFVEEGGVFVVQYNTTYSLTTKQPGPYPITLSRDRVTVEEAPITMLEPDHPVWNSPNKITQADFSDWVQERGLYFPNKWSEEYTPLVRCNDPGEDPKEGALLVAKHGKGYFVYTGFSFFRELPAGVPGAYRLFVNIISLGK